MPFLATAEIYYTIERFLFPITCVGCGTKVEGKTAVCSVCLSTEFMKCERESETYVQKRPYPEYIIFHQSVYQFRKMTLIQQIMHELKYSQNWRVGLQFGKVMGERFSLSLNSEQWKEALVVAVPLHKNKLLKRGYNQAQLLVDGFCEQTGLLSLDPQKCRRAENTVTQTALSLVQRQSNLKEVFLVDDLPPNSSAIIVDDVFTTGATTFELAEALRKAGAEKIGIMTLALS